MTESIHTAEMRTLTRWLREMRESQGLTMRDMGQRVGKPHSFVQKIEAGERRLDVVEYVWYCWALGVTPGHGVDLVARMRQMPEPASEPSADSPPADAPVPAASPAAKPGGARARRIRPAG